LTAGATDIEAAAEALEAGELVILPTETVYGLACDAGDPRAVARVFEAKGRPSFNPLISHVADLKAAERLALFEDKARALAEVYWPGPLTIVAPFRADAPVSDLARAGLDTIAVRAPAHPVAQALLRAFGRPVAAPSANRSGRPSPTCVADAVSETGAFAAAALDGGRCQVGLESTVVSVLAGEARLLRPGGVSREEIQSVIGPLAPDQAEGHRSPGRLARHYAPQTPVRLDVHQPEGGEAFLAFGPCAIDGPEVWNLSPTGDLREAAANLFAYLRLADAAGMQTIAVAPVPHRGLGEAINDRLRRAAGFVG
jgi:L-threonylcarbamoyladenylate synthase